MITRCVMSALVSFTFFAGENVNLSKTVLVLMLMSGSAYASNVCRPGFAGNQALNSAKNQSMIAMNAEYQAAIYSFQETPNNYLIKVGVTETGTDTQGAFFYTKGYDVRINKKDSECSVSNVKQSFLFDAPAGQ